ncbi:MAG TPA: hypothetical protein VNI77_11310 [Nitrososphaera sp.]|nr:hypothetical protein [Nitrososphaera sp.]
MASIDIAASLGSVFPKALVDQVIETYTELKKNFYLGHLRPNEVEGGRFAEAVFRLLEHRTTGSHTPLGQQLDTEKLIRSLSNLPASTQPDSIRLHIPRTLRVIYDIRNKRDAAHLADGIDPNLQDATLVTSSADWVMAELVRLHHSCTANEAQIAIEDLVTRRAPVVQEFGADLKTLRPNLTLAQRLLVLLYHRGRQGATATELSAWVKPSQRKNLRATLWRLVHDLDYAFERNDLYQITRAGQLKAEEKGLLKIR